MTKLNDDHSNHEGTHVRKALRATLILFPLLGITNLLFFVNPKNGTHDKIYVIFNATMQSSQVRNPINLCNQTNLIPKHCFTSFNLSGYFFGHFVLLFKRRSSRGDETPTEPVHSQPRHTSNYRNYRNEAETNKFG